MPRITIKRLVLTFFVIATMLLYLMLIRLIPIPFNISPHKPTLGYRYMVGEDLKIRTYFKYSYTYDPEIEFVEVLVINKTLTSITANITKTLRNNDIITSKQIWHVGNWAFINDTQVIYPIYTSRFFEYAFIGGYLDIGDPLYEDDDIILSGKKTEIWNMQYRNILQYRYSANLYGFGKAYINIDWDQQSGALIKANIFTPEEIVNIDLIETSLFEADWTNFYQYLAVYHFIIGWLWVHVISTKLFVGGVIIWVVSFAIVAVWDKTQRGGFGSGAKRWMPFLLVLVAIVFIRIIIQFLIYGGMAFFG